MKNRKSRIAVITEILNKHVIRSQEDVLKHLQEKGINVTQATLSRDLKKVRASKTTDGKGLYRYVILEPEQMAEVKGLSDVPVLMASQREKFSNAVLSCAISNNIVVIKTRNGYASGLAYDIDTLQSPHILGTVPGADTVLMVVDDALKHEQIIELLCSILPDHVIEGLGEEWIGDAKK